MVSSYEAVIGLEVHAQLHTKSKLFCGCATAYGAPPNAHVCPVCLGLPGALPVPNAEAIALAVRAGLALGCDVATSSRFARKNYFYPDLAKGYQISQFELPLNARGALEVELPSGTKRIGITRIHVEEDAAKNLHGVGAGTDTLVDFNRAGTPLIEIVSEPDLRSAEEAEAYLRKLRDILMFTGVNDGNLEEGSFRCDANVSIRPAGDETLGTRTEIKNVNSFRFVRMAIEHEIARQQAVVEAGGEVVQETRTWSESHHKTRSMRTKEDAHDYRYFPDPDLPPLVVAQARIDAIGAALPELPDAKRTRWRAELGLTEYDAQVLSAHPAVARYFDEVASALCAQAGGAARDEVGKRAANFVQAEILGHVEQAGLDARFPVPAAALAELLRLVERDVINGKIAKRVLSEMIESGEGAEAIVEREGLAQVTDAGAIEAAVRAAIDAHPAQVAQYRAGKTAVLGFFVGQVMKANRGAANPKQVNALLRELLGEP